MKLITLFSFVIILFSCKSSKLDNNVPFKIKKATYQYWTGGQPGVKGIKIELLIENLKETITLKNVYFKNRTETLYLRNSKEENTLFTANFNTSKDQNIDIVLHKDPKKEYGNELPKNIEENQCVISYLKNNKELFYTINLTKLENVSYK